MLLVEVGRTYVKYRKLCKLIFLLITEDSEAFGGEVKSRTAGYYRRFKEGVSTIFKDGIKAGAISPEVDPEALAVLLVAMRDGIAVQETILEKEFSFDTLAGLLTRCNSPKQGFALVSRLLSGAKRS